MFLEVCLHVGFRPCLGSMGRVNCIFCDDFAEGLCRVMQVYPCSLHACSCFVTRCHLADSPRWRGHRVGMRRVNNS